MIKDNTIVIVIPVYNEAKHILQVLKDISNNNYKVILVDDGSSDNSFNLIKDREDIFIVHHKVNLGKGAAMKTGCELAFKLGAKAVVFLDADGQHSTKDVQQFMRALKDGYDVVFGSRVVSYNDIPLVRYMGNKIGGILILILFRIYVSDLLCGYRAITKNGYDKIKWESTRYGVETEMVIRTGNKNVRHCEVPVQTIYLDKEKGVTILDAISIFFDVLRWRITL